MLKSALLKDKRGVISWLLSQIGLMLAAGILLGAIASLTFYSDWQKEAEAKNIASDFVASVESMDLREFPEKTVYLFPQKNYHYEVTISADYVTVVRYDASFGETISAREELLIHPWPDPPVLNEDGAEGLYNYFGSKSESGKDGSSPDNEIPKNVVEGVFNDAKEELAKYPSRVDVNKPVCIEKVFVYTDGGREDYVLVYQG